MKSIYKFHLILSIRFFIGSNEQFTENLADIFKWTRTVWHGKNINACASHSRNKTFDSDFRVTLSVRQKTQIKTFFFTSTFSNFDLCCWMCTLHFFPFFVNEERIKFEITFEFVHLCLFLKTIVLWCSVCILYRIVCHRLFDIITTKSRAV